MSTKWKLAEGFVLRKVDQDYVAVPSGEAARTFSGLIALNETGADIFRLLQVGMTREELLAQMSALYGLAPQEMEADVEEIFAQLRELSVLREVEE